MKEELEIQVNEVKKSTSRIKEHIDVFDTFFNLLNPKTRAIENAPRNLTAFNARGVASKRIESSI